MVSLGVPTVNYGKPFKDRVDSLGRLIPGPPEPYFPGISATRFTPDRALQVFRENLAKENDLRSFQHYLLERRDGGPRILPGGPRTIIAANLAAATEPPRKSDLLPGYSSVKSTALSLGFTVDPCGRFVAPDMHAKAAAVASGASAPGSPPRSAAGSGRPPSSVAPRGMAAIVPGVLGDRLSRSCTDLAAVSKASAGGAASAQENGLISRRFRGQPFVFL
mmetsp:Transcript_36897/g.106429  ORF Transcript_36897/g.106429 Transcript_36897/m.106429 type:complete len:220 (-) Transcript_36897:106-765(-)